MIDQEEIDQEKIHSQCLSDDPEERIKALELLRLNFSFLPDKQNAWGDLHRLTTDDDIEVRARAAYALGYVFAHAPDKQDAWNNIISMTNDKDSYVREWAAYALGSAFAHAPNKQKAWNDLYVFTGYKNQDGYAVECYVRSGTTHTLGSAFSHVPDKQKAWNDLIRLTNDEDRYVKSEANHSLGKISIFKASQAEEEEDYKKELEKAIEFFEKSAQESISDNPSLFCLPFYRSYHSIIFKRQETEEEVNIYLKKAKDAIKGSNSKELLFEAVVNLAEALKEVQSLDNLGLEVKKSELNFYRKYCDRAAELMINTEKTAPFATIAIRKGLPILDRNLKGLIEEIQEKAKTVCQTSQGTPTQEIACTISKEVQKWEIGNQEEMTQKVEDVAYLLKMKVANLPENEYILNKIEAMRQERNLTKQYESLLFVIGQIPIVRVISEQELDHKLLKLDLIYDKTVSIETKLDLIQKELDRDLKKLDLLSFEIGENEGELVKTFSKGILELKERGDKETLNHFLEEIIAKENILIKEIEKSSATPGEKEETKRSILNIRSVIDKVKNPIKSFGKDVTKEIVVTFAAEEIVKLVFQLVSIATLGVPIPPQVLNLLSNMIKESKK